MTTSQATADYALGYTDAEQERLIRQATLIAPHTERLFREAGIGVGHRVLDLGSGMGDVSMLVAGLVGASGEVVGIERDATSIERAQARVAAAGLRNVSFLNTDVNNIVTDRPFDAAVGRYILMFLPDPVSVLRSVSRLVRPGGVLAFQEPSWIPMLALGDRLPLWSCCASFNPRDYFALWREPGNGTRFVSYLSRGRAACAQDASGDTARQRRRFLAGDLWPALQSATIGRAAQRFSRGVGRLRYTS